MFEKRVFVNVQHWRKLQNSCRILLGKHENKKENLEDPVIDGRIVLKLNLKTLDGRT